MAEYGQVQLSFWTHLDIQGLTDQGKLLAIYLLTGPHSNGLGCFRCPVGYVAEDLGWNIEKVQESYNALTQIDFVRFDEATSWILIPHYLKYNPIQNQSVGTAIAKLVRSVPKSSPVYPELIKCLEQYANHLPEGFIKEINTVPTPCKDGVSHRVDTVPTPCRHPEPEPEPSLSKDKEWKPSSYFSRVITACKNGNGNRNKFNGYMFVNKMRKDYAAHPLALELAICKTNDKLNAGKMEGQAWPYALRIFQKENNRYNEQDHLAEAKEFSSAVDRFLQTDEAKEILSHLNLDRPP